MKRTPTRAQTPTMTTMTCKTLVFIVYAASLTAVGGMFAAHAGEAAGVSPALSAGDSAPMKTDDLLSALAAQAASGERDAARALATLYYLGHGTAADTDQAIRWWQTAAAAGDTTAAYNAGLLLVRDPTRADAARGLLEQAAASGDVLACFVLGTHHAERGDHTAALTWLERAARQGYVPAQYNLARVLASKTPPDVAGARLWFGAAAATFAPATAALAALPQASASATRPHGRDWVLAQAPAAFTIQVGAGRDRSALERLLTHGAPEYETALFEHRPAASAPYSAILGVFEARTDAAAALARLPPALQDKAPWIRPFAVLQRELMAFENAADAAPSEP